MNSLKEKKECPGKEIRPDFVIAYPKKYKSYNFSRQECKKQGFSRIGGRACYFTRLFARLPKQQKQPLIIKHLQTYFEKVTKSGKRRKSVPERRYDCCGATSSCVRTELIGTTNLWKCEYM